MFSRRDILKALSSAAAVTALGAVPARAQAPVSEEILIQNVRVFDGLSDVLSGVTNVRVNGELIVEVSPQAKAGPEARHIDGTGHILMPGLIDMHTHLQWNQDPYSFMSSRADYLAALTLRECRATLMRGFTSVRDTGGGILGVARAIDEGVYSGPRIQACNAAIGMTAGHGDFRNRSVRPRALGGPESTEMEHHGITVIADGVPEVLTATREQFRQGAHFIKVFSGGAVSGVYDPLDINEYSRAELEAAAGEALRWNTYAASHAYTDASIRAAIEAGFKSIEHGNLISRETMELLVAKDVWLSTQTGVFLVDFPEGFSEAQRERQKMARDGLNDMMLLAKEMGAKIALGGDLVGGPEPKRAQLGEFAARAEWFSNAEILRQATGLNGQLFALAGPRNPYQAGPIGVVQEWAYADMLLVKGDPIQDISVMASENNFSVIIKGGRIYKNMVS